MATGANELGDSRSFGEVGVAVAATPQLVSPPAFEGVPVPDPQVVEALRADDSDAEPEFIEGESDDEAGPVPPLKESFHTKEEAVLAVKNYNIRRRVEYRVMESDHAKYLGK
ncbi:hypothetical protein PIB30_069817 [Stylosanthes scabra]|uniref:Uncharacterized protein n=1 Tax=Stylosanthes scabra TaxID=79078 RepID=A0ABU6RNH2_9FABA|nr:hypothetical protein [Stylosanthes scabra]